MWRPKPLLGCPLQTSLVSRSLPPHHLSLLEHHSLVLGRQIRNVFSRFPTVSARLKTMTTGECRNRKESRGRKVQRSKVKGTFGQVSAGRWRRMSHIPSRHTHQTDHLLTHLSSLFLPVLAHSLISSLSPRDLSYAALSRAHSRPHLRALWICIRACVHARACAHARLWACDARFIVLECLALLVTGFQHCMQLLPPTTSTRQHGRTEASRERQTGKGRHRANTQQK